MERILRSCIQVGGNPESDHALSNWNKLQEHDLEFPLEEDRRVYEYLKTFYGSFSAPPDYPLIKEYFEKKDQIETVSRLEEIKTAQFFTHTNFLSIVRSEREQQTTKSFLLACRDAAQIAEHGRNLEKPIEGKKVLRGTQDAIGYLFDKMSQFTSVESGEKLEGDVTQDVDEVLEEYNRVATTGKFANRNLFGLEPVDSACRGHKAGEYWIHTAFTGELKCLSGDATVYDHAAMRRRTVREIFESGDLPTLTAVKNAGERNELVGAHASHVVQNGIRDVFDVTLESGRSIPITDNHGVLTPNGWRELKDLCVGDWVGVPKVMRVEQERRDYSSAEVKAIGYLIGDGYLGRSGMSLTASNDAVRRDFMNCLEAMGMRESPFNGSQPSFREEFAKDRAPGVKFSRAKGVGYTPFVSPILELIECLGLKDKLASEKFIPDEFFFLPEQQVCEFLGALWSTDGSFHHGDHIRTDRASLSKRNDIRYHSTSKRLCTDVQSLLLRIGVQSSVITYTFEYNGLPYTAYVTSVVGSANKRRFVDKVSVVGKEQHVNAIKSRLSQLDDDVYPAKLIRNGLCARLLNGKKRYSSQCRRGTVQGHVLRAFASVDPNINEHLDGDIRWERIRSITLRGQEMTYDISVPEHRSFVSNDIITHNTTTSLNYLYNNTYLYEKNIFYAILEMPYSQLRRQLYVLHSSHGKFVTEWNAEDKRRGIPENERYLGLDYRKVRDGELDEIGHKRLVKVAQDFKATRKGIPYIWRPELGNPTIKDIRRKAEMFHNKYGCDGIIIDHLGLIKPTHRSNDQLSMINSVIQEGRMLALNFARGKTVPVLGLFQLNRQGKMRADKADGKYDIAAISTANEVEKSADVITYTYLNEELRRQGKFYLGCLKNRDNAIFERMVGKVLWQSKRMRAIETGMIDMNADQIKAQSKTIAIMNLNIDDMTMP